MLKHDERVSPYELGVFMGVYTTPEQAARFQNVPLSQWDNVDGADEVWAWTRPLDGTVFTIQRWLLH